MQIDWQVADGAQQLEKVYILNNKLNTHVGSMEAAKEIRDEAKRNCPVSTEQTRPGGPHGDLKDSIRCWETSEGATISAGGVARSGLYVDYAVYVEFGTWRMQAQPYIRPAIDHSHITQAFQNALQNFLSGL